MALVLGCPSDLRIYKPSSSPRFPSPEEESESRSRLLRKIHAFYLRASKRLGSMCPRRSGRRHAADADGFPCVGLCFGLLDPVSNIVINSLVSGNDVTRRRRAPLVLEDLERRSLDGMVTFLTRLFPDLAECQAVRYLHLAGADLLVAARAVASDAGMKRFECSSSRPAAVEALGMALKCAALAAGHAHPDAARLIGGWHKVSSRVDEAIRLLGCSAAAARSTPPALASSPEEDLWWAWQLAACRRIRVPRAVPFRHTWLLNRTLQDAIHGLYMQALARLPAGELRSRFHRSLLKGGHCYGPLDPVSNIIVNTVWYDAAFPRTHELDLDVVGTLSLHRMENRSLYAQDPDTGVEEAFLAAATAAHHPNPDAQVKLLTKCKAMLGWSALSLLQGGGKLSSEDVQRLALLLSPESYCDREKPLPVLPLTGYPRAEVAYEHTRISKKVKDVLNAYERMPNGDPTFELHTICGVNDYVSGPAGPRRKFFYHSHINFLATPKSPLGGGVSVLFFAEISTNDYDRSFCCPIPLPLPCAAQSRCLYCEFKGIRIVHPVGADFHGRELEFEKMVCGEDPCDNDLDPTQQPFYTKLAIINYRCLTTDTVRGTVKEDSLYDDVDEHRRVRGF
ncbi:unnamed protein product [Urochloa decumbens]|uniref:Uncharacterized protein n=1 Tax=Urochloa decumbens TaxID=240449 RepID=A0ABC8WKP1_9POAL